MLFMLANIMIVIPICFQNNSIQNIEFWPKKCSAISHMSIVKKIECYWMKIYDEKLKNQLCVFIAMTGRWIDHPYVVMFYSYVAICVWTLSSPWL
jgi:hypothetical protein